jgi:uncharacterized protein YodC (DUF2158 family)
MSLKRRAIKTSDIEMVCTAESFRSPYEPPLRLGNVVRLNSGGPPMLVVDVECNAVIVAWRDGAGATFERRYPTDCVHRASIASASI